MEDTKLNSHSGSELQKFKISSFSLSYTLNMSLDKIRKKHNLKLIILHGSQVTGLCCKK